MKKGMVRYMQAKSFDIPKPCERITKMEKEMHHGKIATVSNEYSKIWSLKIGYPDEFKVIAQSKEVDVHSLIGNIGGYFGLFLGILRIK